MSPVRRVRRVIRRIDPWTVLKVSFVFNAIMALAFVLGSIIFWSIFVNAGVPDRLTEFAESLTLSFEVDGELYFRVVLFLSIIGAILLTGLATLGSVLYNLIADTVGGVEVVVLEEVLAPVAAPSGTTAVRPVRRPATRRGPSKTAPGADAAARPAAAQQPRQTPSQQAAPQQPSPEQAEPAAGGQDKRADTPDVADRPTSESRVAP